MEREEEETVVVLGEALLSSSDCEIVEPQSSSLSRKRHAFLWKVKKI